MAWPELDEDQLSAAARLAALLDRHDPADPPTVATVQAATTDRQVLGDVLGTYLYRLVIGGQAEALRYWPVLEILRRSGADEERAAAKAHRLRSASAA
jgi:hypothetical protein